MMQDQKPQLREFYARVAPHLPELFNMAHAITGNYDLAEYALLGTLVKFYQTKKPGGIGFRDELKDRLIANALPEARRTLNEEAEMTWELTNDGAGDAVSRRLYAGSTALRRVVCLRYGCNLPHGKIAEVTGLSAGNVRDMLEQFERRVNRSLGENNRRHPEAVIAEWMRKRFAEPDRVMPPNNMIYRSFESEVSQEIMDSEPKHNVSRALSVVLGLLMTLVGVGIFWLLAVLLQSPTPI